MSNKGNSVYWSTGRVAPVVPGLPLSKPLKITISTAAIEAKRQEKKSLIRQTPPMVVRAPSATLVLVRTDLSLMIRATTKRGLASPRIRMLNKESLFDILSHFNKVYVGNLSRRLQGQKRLDFRTWNIRRIQSQLIGGSLALIYTRERSMKLLGNDILSTSSSVSIFENSLSSHGFLSRKDDLESILSKWWNLHNLSLCRRQISWGKMDDFTSPIH